MAKDVAQRDLDQAGFRISKLGDPKAAGDATKTDNSTTPKPASGTGSAGTSLLAAPADHVHPAAPGTGSNGEDRIVVLDDSSMQEVSNESAIIWETSVNFDDIGTIRSYWTLCAVVFAPKGKGSLELRVGGDPGQTDGVVVLKLDCDKPASELKTATADTLKPLYPQLLKLVAHAPTADDILRVRSKSITIRGNANVR